MRNMEQMMILLRARSRGRRRSYLPTPHLLAIVAAFVLGCSTASAVDPGAAAPSAKQGDQIFHQRCIVCHNKQPDDHTPFGPPNLYAVFRGHPPLTMAQAETTIMNGRGQMPPFKAILTRTEIRSVIAYLRSNALIKHSE
jgi:mono/diheme cytochrome c family protein